MRILRVPDRLAVYGVLFGSSALRGTSYVYVVVGAQVKYLLAQLHLLLEVWGGKGHIGLQIRVYDKIWPVLIAKQSVELPHVPL